MSGKEKELDVANKSGEIIMEPSILWAPLKYPNAVSIWVSTDNTFPCFDDPDIILPFLRNFYPVTAVIKCISSHDALVVYQVEVPGWLAIPAVVYERREFRPARLKCEKR